MTHSKSFVKIPNLPDKQASVVILDGRAPLALEEKLLSMGTRCIRTSAISTTYKAVCCHPDIILHHVGDCFVVHSPGIPESLANSMKELGIELIQGSSVPGMAYPINISYNAARVGRYVFHNLDHTDKILLSELEKREVELVHVRQGYSKCSISIVDSESIITSDKGIAKAAEKKGLNVLLTTPDRGIVLPGLDYGFIGGASFMLSPRHWAVAGNFDRLEAAYDISDFLEKRNIQSLSLMDGPVTDIGSILPLI